MIDFTRSYEKLLEPFDPSDVEWRAGTFTEKRGGKALAFAYITARAVMKRLDEVVGPENWMDSYKSIDGTGGDRGYFCTISIRIGDEWVSKTDGADESDFESIKGGISDAFKRAAIKWGIGRYLYDLGQTWVPATKNGRYVKITTPPTLPQWALPADYKGTPTGDNYATSKLGDEPEEEDNIVEYTEKELEEAKKVVVPAGVPFAGKTLEDASEDEAVGVFVVKYLTGDYKNQSGMKFKAITDEDKKVQKAAQIVYAGITSK